MAAALRKVSQNYDWTIKRAHNDLHHNITTPQPQPQPQPTSPSFLVTNPEDLSSWDSDHLRWKFKNDCEELRELLGRVFFILFGWAVTLNYLRKIATRHFIKHPVRSIAGLYKKSRNLKHLDIRATSIWNLLVALLRIGLGDTTHDTSVSQFAKHLVAEEPLGRAPQVSDGVQEPVKDDTGNDASDAALLLAALPLLSVIDDLKGGSDLETIHTRMHDDTRRHSLRKAQSNNEY